MHSITPEVSLAARNLGHALVLSGSLLGCAIIFLLVLALKDDDDKPGKC